MSIFRVIPCYIYYEHILCYSRSRLCRQLLGTAMFQLANLCSVLTLMRNSVLFIFVFVKIKIFWLMGKIIGFELQRIEYQILLGPHIVYMMGL